MARAVRGKWGLQMTNPALSAIHAKCLDCSGGSRKLAAECKIDSCPLHPFRPFVQGAHKPDCIQGQVRMDDYLNDAIKG